MNTLDKSTETLIEEAVEPTEEWRDVVGYEGLYQVSNRGRVIAVFRNGRFLKQGFKEGYPRVTLIKSGVQKGKFVHRLVAQAFIPNPENKPQVNHKDFNRGNSNVENLEWCTPQENVDHAIQGGDYNFGEKHGTSRFKNEDILKMRSLYEDGMTQMAIAKMYGTKNWYVWSVVHRKYWKHI